MEDDSPQLAPATFADFLDDYFAECDEHLTGVRRLLLALDVSAGSGQLDRGAIHELFRLFHSLKGISGMVQLRPAEDLAHRLEDYLRALRQGDAALTVEGVDALLDGAQVLEQVIGAHRAGGPMPPIDPIAERIAHLLADRALAPASGSSEPARPAAGSASASWRCTFTPSADRLARGVSVDSVRQRLSILGEIRSATPRVAAAGAITFDFVVGGVLPGDAEAALREIGVTLTADEEVAAQPGLLPDEDQTAAVAPLAPAASVSPSHVVRVDLTRLDDLMRNVGDMVISRARLVDVLGRVESLVPAGDWRSIQDNILLGDRQLRTLREGIMRVRLVPVGEIFRRMPFVVRDLSRETGKRVRLELQGQSTEIDKFLIERLMDPVLHLVRNAVSHGIETADERVAAGKPPDGTITLSASTIGDIVRIEIADDGRGIDADAVVARAKQAGLAVPAGTPDAATLLSLICAPGFSTREETDRASGRGVGMGVVQAAVAELSGSLALETTPGGGTTFVLELPVTLAIADALIAEVGDETFAIPQSAVREVIDVEVAALVRLERNDVMPYRGGALPVIRLSSLLNLVDAGGRRLHLFVVGLGSSALGIAVDRIVGHREVVVRAIADPLVRVDGISGATDLGDGRVVLILDPAALVRRTRERPDRVFHAAQGVR